MDTKNKKLKIAKYEIKYVKERLKFLSENETFLDEQRDSKEYVVQMLINKLETAMKVLDEIGGQHV